jgi:hypothetical protein
VIAAPAQLPADLADFTGHAGQVKLLVDLLGGGGSRPGVVPVCVVTGPGGIGKTALAVHAAHQARDQFPGGQLYARLGHAGPGAVLEQFTRDLAGGQAPAMGEAGQAAWLRSLLAGRRVLIVLDDARDSAQVAPLLPGSGGCAVLVTSRSTLADLPSAHRVALTVLTSAQALELLAAIIGTSRVAAEPRAAAQVAELCAGLPLALRIAASRLAARPTWRIADLAARLADADTRLDELAAGGLSVRASFAASYHHLPPGPAAITPSRAFRLLGLWPAPHIGAPAAAALFGVTQAAAETVLETLLDNHLLQPAWPVGYYRLHDLVRLYAAERAEAEESPPERARRRAQPPAYLVPSQRP